MSMLTCKCGGVLQSKRIPGVKKGYFYHFICPQFFVPDSMKAIKCSDPIVDKRNSVYQTGTMRSLGKQLARVEEIQQGKVPEIPGSHNRLKYSKRIIRVKKVRVHGRIVNPDERARTIRLENLFRQIGGRR
jgi:hypothetical protein